MEHCQRRGPVRSDQQQQRRHGDLPLRRRPQLSGINNYGVRVLDSPQLPGYPLNVANPLGITVASDQAIYIEGDYNNFA